MAAAWETATEEAADDDALSSRHSRDRPGRGAPLRGAAGTGLGLARGSRRGFLSRRTARAPCAAPRSSIPRGSRRAAPPDAPSRGAPPGLLWLLAAEALHRPMHRLVGARRQPAPGRTTSSGSRSPARLESRGMGEPLATRPSSQFLRSLRGPALPAAMSFVGRRGVRLRGARRAPVGSPRGRTPRSRFSAGPERSAPTRTDASHWQPSPAPPFEVLVVLPGGRYMKPFAVAALPESGPVLIAVEPLAEEAVTVTAGAAPTIESRRRPTARRSFRSSISSRASPPISRRPWRTSRACPRSRKARRPSRRSAASRTGAA